MIKFLQSGNKAAKYILAGFLLVLAASMVTYLIPGFMSSDTVTTTGVVATVGSHEISRDDVARIVEAQQRQQAYPAALLPFLNQRAIQELIQEAEVSYESERMGLNVSDKEVQDELRTGMYKETFFPNGQWIGADKYKQLLQQAEVTPERFESGIKNDLLRRKLFSVVAANAVVSQAELEQAFKDKNTKVKFQYALIKLDDILKTIKPTDTELKAFFNANQGHYQNAIPEKRTLKYFVLNDKDTESKITIDPADIQRYYSAHQDDFRVPERAKVRHILIETPKPGPDGKVDQKGVDEARAKAQDVLKQVKAGGDFAVLAKKYSQDPGSKDNGGELGTGWITRGQTVPEFEKVAFSQSKGQISDLVQTEFGFHIIQTEDKEEAHLKPLSEVKPEIEKAVRQEKLNAVLNKLSGEVQDFAQKQGLEKAAAKYGAQVVQSNPVARTDSLPGVGSQPTFMDTVFTGQDKGPQIGRTPTGYVIFEITKIEPPRSPSLEEIRDRVVTDFKNERANDLLRRKTQEMADRAHAEHDLAKAAKEAGATVKTSDLVGRTGQVTDIGSMGGPASVAFGLKQGEISGPLNFGRSQGVLQVVDRQEPSPSDPEFAKQRDQLHEELAQQKEQELLAMFMSDLGTRLEKEGKVKINKTEMDNLTKARS
ncbi:MAG TPA: peptidylprolyl isomerase [Candidatus Angelobacter sp.]|nr:peptidylprolyl isomerase [Candidatus Angelobacter sp.]